MQALYEDYLSSTLDDGIEFSVETQDDTKQFIEWFCERHGMTETNNEIKPEETDIRKRLSDYVEEEYQKLYKY